MSARSEAPPVITFLSDYGRSDEFVGVCHGVIARRCPQARVIDLTHEIPAQDVRQGALVLASAAPYLPAGVHLAIVDPGVGASGARGRRAVALRASEPGHALVGPNNGLLMAAAEALGGVAEALDISRSPERLPGMSATFHGRDLFAPVAAALAAGVRLSQVGQPLDPSQLCALEVSRASVSGGALHTRVLRSDHFGNLVLDARAPDLSELGARPGSEVAIHHGGGVHVARLARAFADVPEGELLLYEDSQRLVSVAVNRGSAAALLGAAAGAQLEVRLG
jgi:S-adenosyl-L-methionine hydrolase (adenosine-forming)